MEEVADIIKVYRIVFIDNLFISLLIIKLFSRFFAKEAYPISKEIIRWLIIVCTVASTLSWMLFVAIADSSGLILRATGLYWWSFWIIIFLSDILPFILLFKKIGKNGWVILAVLLMMNAVWMFERFVIIVTSLHRDYLPSGWAIYPISTPLLTFLLHGIIEGIIITGISIFVMKYKNHITHKRTVQ